MSGHIEGILADTADGPATSARSLLDQMPAMVAYWDRDLRNVYANGRFGDLVGVSPAALRGRLLRDVVVASDAERGPADLASVLDGTTMHLSGAVVDARGRRQQVEATYVPDVVAGRTVGFFTLLADASSRTGAPSVVGDGAATRHRRASDRAFRQIATASANGVAIDDIAQLVAQALLELFETDTCAVVRFLDGELDVVAARPSAATSRRRMARGVEATAADLVAADGAAHLVRHDLHARGWALREREAGLVAGVAAPIRVHGGLWGAVSVGLHHEELGDELERLDGLATTVAASVSSALAWDQLRALANTDVLTGLSNRRGFEEHFRHAELAAQRHERTVGLVLIDLHRFKEVNDVHGHPTGDAVLIGAGQRLAAVTRRDELLARIGGDEFALLMEDVHPREVTASAARLETAIASAPIGGLEVTCVTGTAALSGSDVRLEALLSRAGAQLAEAKARRSGGRGRRRLAWLGGRPG